MGERPAWKTPPKAKPSCCQCVSSAPSPFSAASDVCVRGGGSTPSDGSLSQRAWAGSINVQRWQLVALLRSILSIKIQRIGSWGPPHFLFLHGDCELVHSQWLRPSLACLGRLENRDALGEKYGGPRGESRLSSHKDFCGCNWSFLKYGPSFIYNFLPNLLDFGFTGTVVLSVVFREDGTAA